MTNRGDDRDRFSRAMSLGYLILSICTEMIVPVIVGYWLDRHWGKEPLLTLLGLVVGLAAGFWGLLKLMRQSNRPDDQQSPRL